MEKHMTNADLEKMLKENERLVGYIIYKYGDIYYTIEKDDMEQMIRMAFCKAYPLYDPSKNCKLSTILCTVAVRAISRLHRDNLAIKRGSGVALISLNEKAYSYDEDNDKELQDTLSQNNILFDDKVEIDKLLEDILYFVFESNTFTEKEKNLFNQLILNGRSQSSLMDDFKISQVMASRTLKRIRNKIKKEFGNEWNEAKVILSKW